ncbi:agropine synthesis reductase [Azorhizobium oxalatiphilum]|uniref:Agropine synthesis reductase n=1 Tax=Azorhizobium oxalatiphilum TaxID=980631 RepID=A0A917FG29_9HYPH|nr:SDR family NAD(P)-dependent oxidoreductase [Azorhizobium oxalatiphilum]GGF81990.1 agropine synthesis reductase [Azorhizobium oxalatiphilum]
MPDPHRRVALVSGASRGIGRAVAERLQASGFRISAGVRDLKHANLPEGIHTSLYDAGEAASAQRWIDEAQAAYGRIDVLVNAAGINTKARLLDADETPFDDLWNINSMGPLRVIRAAWPHLVASGSGRVINISSLSGKRVRNENVGYAMSKHALVALTHAVRQHGWEHGIRATALCPGFVDTDMTATVTKVPRAAMSRPEDIALLVEALVQLPNTASVAELLVNCQKEDML